MRALAAAVLTAALAGVTTACPIVAAPDTAGDSNCTRLAHTFTATGGRPAAADSDPTLCGDTPPAVTFDLTDPPPAAPLWCHGAWVFTTPADPPSRIARGDDLTDPTGDPEPRSGLPVSYWLVALGSVIVGGIVAVLRRTTAKG